jgi:hypothetical protein
MSSEKTALVRVRDMLAGAVGRKKEPVIINLHPVDRENIRRAAELKGMEFEEFCALTLHEAAREIGAKQ